MMLGTLLYTRLPIPPNLPTMCRRTLMVSIMGGVHKTYIILTRTVNGGQKNPLIRYRNKHVFWVFGCAPHTFIAFSLVLLFGCCRFGSEPNWRKILMSDNIRSDVTRSSLLPRELNPQIVSSLGRQSCKTASPHMDTKGNNQYINPCSQQYCFI